MMAPFPTDPYREYSALQGERMYEEQAYRQRMEEEEQIARVKLFAALSRQLEIASHICLNARHLWRSPYGKRLHIRLIVSRRGRSG